MEKQARFSVGQLIRHALFGYRGVIVAVDPGFSLSDAWYETMARSKPPRDAPWYHVLPHNQEHMTYVAERNLEPAESDAPIAHPLLEHLFESFAEGRYILRERPN